MTVKPETNFWKSFKKYLDDGKYMSSRIESYVTPGFPDCVVYHDKCGFFTVELKVLRRNKKGMQKYSYHPFSMPSMCLIQIKVLLYLSWSTTPVHAP